MWDVRIGVLIRSLPAHSDPIGSVDFTPDGTLIASCATDGLIRIWDTASGQCLRTIVHEDNAKVTHVKFSPNGKFILAWTVDNSVRLWDYVEGSCKKTYQGHRNEKYSIGGAFGVWEGEAVVVGPSEDGRVVWWDVGSKEVLLEVGAHEGVVTGVDVDGQGRVLSCGMDGWVKVWVPEVEEEREGDRVGALTNGVEDVHIDGAAGDEVMVNATHALMDGDVTEQEREPSADAMDVDEQDDEMIEVKEEHGNDTPGIAIP